MDDWRIESEYEQSHHPKWYDTLWSGKMWRGDCFYQECAGECSQHHMASGWLTFNSHLVTHLPEFIRRFGARK
jgi:hypothetical protein